MSETNAEDAGYSTNRKFRRAVGRVLIALSFKPRQKSERFQGDDCEDVTKTSDRNPTEVTDDQPSRKNYGQPETVFALKDSTEMKAEKSIEEPTEEEFIIKSSASYSREMSVTPPKGLGFSYPGDLLSEGRPRQTTPVRRVIPPPLIKRNTIADFVSNRGFQTAVTTLSASSPGTDQEKKTKSTFSLLKLIDKKSNRSKENLSQLNDVLQNLEQSEFVDHGLALYKDGHWLKVVVGSEADDELSMSHKERRRREAVWELFTSECVFLFDHLMVLKHCFLEPLKKVRAEGFLSFVDSKKLFGNLDDLCHVSYTFCYDFIQLLLKDTKMAGFGKTEVLLHGLRRFSELTRDGEVYHDYCLNYPDAMGHLEILRKNEEFCEYEKWCEQDRRCHRLKLPDLLISPMQHCTKVPLLLNNIRRYTQDPNDQLTLAQSLEKLEDSLKTLNLKMTLMRNLERVHQIQRQLYWAPIVDFDPKTNIPEFLRVILADQPSADILCDRQRHLINEGPVTLNEISSKTVDGYMFLFDDVLLITKIKKQQRKRTAPADWNSKSQLDGRAESFHVHKQPIALDCLTFNDIKQSEATAHGLKNVFVVLNRNRFQQIVNIYTIQTQTEAEKTVWLHRLQTEQQRYRDKKTFYGLSCGIDDACGGDYIQEGTIPPSYLSCSAWNTYRERGSSSVGASPNRLSPSSTQLPENSGAPSPSSSSAYADLPSLVPRARANADLSSIDGDVNFAEATTTTERQREAVEEGEGEEDGQKVDRKSIGGSSSSGDVLLRRRPQSEAPTAAAGDGRPASWHPRRRIQLKAIREKSLSFDLPTTAGIVSLKRLH